MTAKHFMLITLISAVSLASQAARENVVLYTPQGQILMYCTDNNGVIDNASGVYATGVTAGGCPVATPTPIPTPPPTLNQLLRASITYQYANGTVQNVDLTQMKNIYGRVTSVQPLVDFPFTGSSGSTPTINVGAGRVIIAQFTVPTTITSQQHQLKNPSYFSTPGVTASISTLPGDFNPPQAACVKHNAANDDNSMINIRILGLPNIYYCHLTPGTTYYLNLKYESPTRSGPLTTTWN
jgi:hypothetical protein